MQDAVTSSFSNTASATTAAAAVTPATWQSTDVGGSPGVVSVSGGGAGVAGARDAFGFRSLALTGTVDVIARVTGITGAGSGPAAGLMIRNGLTDTAAHAFIRVAIGGGSSFLHRVTPGGSTTNSAGTAGGTPTWLRITRTGSTVSAYQSANGSTWTPVGSVSLTLSATIQTGLAVSGYNDGAVATAAFDNVTIVQGAP